MQGTPERSRVVRRRTVMALVWLLVALSCSWLVLCSEQRDREGLEERFQARADTGARFVQSYTADVLSREQQLARTNLQGDVTAEGLQRLVVENGFQAAVVLDSSGRLLASYPPSSALVGSDLTGTYAHLRAAVAGVPSVSGVVLSAVGARPVVGFAAPFDSPTGRRVFSGAYATEATPLRSYLATESGQVPEATYLLDARNAVVAAGRQVPAGQAVPDSDLVAAAARPGAATLGHGSAQREVVTVPVADTPWRLVYVARTSALLQPLGWSSVWLARLILLGLLLAALVAAVLLERTLTQQARIQAEQARCRAVLHGAVDAFVGADVAGRITDWNPAAERLFGWPAEAALGSPLEELLLPARTRGATGGLHVLTAVGADVAAGPVETVMLHRDGGELPVEVSVSPTDTVSGTSAFLRDISERRRLEHELQNSERVFRSAFEHALLGMTLTRRDGRLMRVNQVLADLLGRPVTSFAGRHFEEFMHVDSRGRSGDQVRRTLAGEIDGFRDEICYVHADGSLVWTEMSAALVRDQAGRPLHYVTQLLDVTERRAALRERDAREAMMNGIISNSQSLISVKDLDGRYLLVNAPFEQAAGLTEEELLGRTNHDLDPSAAPRWRENDLRALDGAFRLEETFTRDGRVQTFDSVRFPLYDADGAPYAICGVSLDVTEQRRAAAAIAQARDEALAATAAKSAFLATMSHEIRTPLNAVIGMSGLLLDTDLDDQQRDFAETVRSSGDALLTVINDILDFSKIESGQLQLEKWSFDLVDAVEGALDLVAVPAGAKGLDLVCAVADTCPPQLVGDLVRVRQVLVNLLSNAVKFTATGDVVLRVSAQPHPSGRLAVAFSVQDTGIGIAPEGLGRLFQSFRQVDDSTTRVYGGTGLGLAISRRLAQAMDGDLVVSSVAGEGSTFTFTALLEAAVSVPPQSSPASPGQAALPAGARVLLVDDNARVREVLAAQLAGWGVSCTAVGTAAEALAAVDGAAAFDLAVLDRSVPGTAGGRLVDQLRGRPGGRDLPLVLLAGLGDPAEPEPALFAAVLTKPVRRAAVRHTLAGVLTPRPARTAVITPPAPAPAEPLPVALRRRVLLAEDNAVNQKVATLMLARLGHDVDIVSNGREAVQALRDVPYDVVAHGRPDAPSWTGSRRPAGSGRARAGAAAADRRDDRERPGRGPRRLPGGRHGQLPVQAGARGRPPRRRDRGRTGARDVAPTGASPRAGPRASPRASAVCGRCQRPAARWPPHQEEARMKATNDLAVAAHGLTKRYGATTALAGLDLAARRGTVLGVLGPNGAGKTTAVRIFATLARSDEGQAWVDGIDVAKTHKREEVWDVVRSLVREGATVLLTTQYLEEAEALADEISVIDAGRVNRP